MNDLLRNVYVPHEEEEPSDKGRVFREEPDLGAPARKSGLGKQMFQNGSG